MIKKLELVFIACPGMGHVVTTVELAKQLVARTDHLLNSPHHQLPFDPNLASYTDSFAAASTSDRIKFIDISQNITFAETDPIVFVNSFIETHKPHVKNTVTGILNSGPDSPRLAGFVVDTLMSTMIDVVNEFGVPSYVFFTSGAGLLSFMFHLQALTDEHGVDPTRFRNKPDSKLIVPGFVNPVLVSVLPGVVVDEASAPIMLNHARRIRSQSKGFVVDLRRWRWRGFVVDLQLIRLEATERLRGGSQEMAVERLRDRSTRDGSGGGEGDEQEIILVGVGGFRESRVMVLEGNWNPVHWTLSPPTVNSAGVPCRTHSEPERRSESDPEHDHDHQLARQTTPFLGSLPVLRELRKLRRAPSEGNRLRAGTHEQPPFPLVLTPSAAAEQQARFPRRLCRPVGGSPFGIHRADGGAREGHRLGSAGGRAVAPGGLWVRVALRVELGAR
ncbi:hypothetical protein TIFTF001_001735 [Ficus carica]|uniref:Uncharacterized protein n=1 Tax=Ficus carica TaxID=3494 RepID=A0AA87Z0M8_FICCA|nr:hypothetical protein TIFTF001_001735 [Ficus carica]